MIEQIKKSSLSELEEIATRIRKRIIEVVSDNGGHLAPSLGVVELTIALHHVFDSPKDSIVWDVGHQAYAHKIITGRDSLFDNIRQMGGMSGFPKRSESAHDPFGTGHSSTSISAALGIAEGKRMSGEPGKTIAVIGDGSMTGGLAYEGLNNAGHILNKRLIVVLNDNQMSIDKNVGALARFMNRGLIHPAYNRLRRDLRILLKIVSTKQYNFVEMSRRAATVVKDFFLAGSLFEAFGFRYIGPVDGHDFDALISNLKNVASIIDAEEEKTRPVLLHVITTKGKGYVHAENDPSRFHGIGAFNIEDGKASSGKKSGNPTYTQVFGNTMCELMQMDNRVVAITAAMPTGTGLDRVKDRFPGRYFDVGIAEAHATIFAAGLATRGFRPVLALYSSFLQRAYDPLIHDVCLQNLPVIFAIDRAGVVGEDGPTHHGLFDLSYMRHIPNMTIMSPKDEEELRRMLWAAVSYGRPVAIRYPRGEALGVPLGSGACDIPIGSSETIEDPADARVAIMGIGNMVSVAIAAAAQLKESGIPAAVINARFVKPLDEKCIVRQAELGRTIVTIEDNMLAGGFGSAVLELLNSRGLHETKVICCGYPDSFVEHGTIKELHRRYGLTPDAIAERVIQIVKIPASLSEEIPQETTEPRWPIAVS